MTDKQPTTLSGTYGADPRGKDSHTEMRHQTMAATPVLEETKKPSETHEELEQQMFPPSDDYPVYYPQDGQ